MSNIICGLVCVTFVIILILSFIYPRIKFAKYPHEVKKILRNEINKYRKKSYSELVKLTKDENIVVKEVIGESGCKYQIEIQAFWDSKKGKDLRVLFAIDGGGIPATMPLSGSFIISPEGKFIGEGKKKRGIWKNLGLV